MVGLAAGHEVGVIHFVQARGSCPVRLAFQLTEELVDSDQVDEALEAVALKVELVVLALLQQRFFDLCNRQPVVLLVELDFMVRVVIVFLRLRVHHALDQSIDCPVVMFVVLLVLNDA